MIQPKIKTVIFLTSQAVALFGSTLLQAGGISLPLITVINQYPNVTNGI